MKSCCIRDGFQKNAVRGKVAKIGLFGMYSYENLGDTAIQNVVMGSLRARRSNIAFVGLSHDGTEVAKTFGIAGFSSSGDGCLVTPCDDARLLDQKVARLGERIKASEDRRFVGPLRALLRKILPPIVRSFLANVIQTCQRLRKIDREMQKLDVLIISGGGQIDDFYGGPWRQPFRMFSWCFAAWTRKKPIGVLGVGVDELQSRLSAWFVIRALRMARYRTFRDSGSLNILRNMGMKASGLIIPDPAFAFYGHFKETGMAVRGSRTRFAAISPISKRAYPGMSDADYSAYLRLLSSVAEALLRKGLDVRFVCSQIEMDPPAVSDVIALMDTIDRVSVAEVNAVDEFLLAVNEAEIVIASRLHGLILSMVAGTPIIAIASTRKVKQLMMDVKLEYYCCDQKSVKKEELLLIVEAALNQKDEIKDHIQSHVNDLREKVEMSFDDLVTIIPSPDQKRI